MDCRRTLLPALWMLTCALGCAHEHGEAPVRETAPPPLANRSIFGPSKRDSEPPQHLPLASTCVQAGNFFSGEAVAMDKGSTAQEQMRDKARKAYQQALSIDPSHLPAYQALAHLYVDMEDYDHAVATYHRALQIQPRNGGMWYDLGICQARRKDWPAALDCLGHAVECDPENRQFVNTLGFALARAGQYQASLTCFARVNNEAMANYHLARMLHHLKQDNLSRQFVITALQKDPTLERAQTLLAQLSAAPGTTVAPAVQQVAYIQEVVATPQSIPTAAVQPVVDTEEAATEPLELFAETAQPAEAPQEMLDPSSSAHSTILPPPPARIWPTQQPPRQ